ncbi:ribosomal protein L7/L12 [Flavobacterium sp. GCM10027622]|uniref:ribosomal protein L7/L12 n=1 Tax=unclassified Flavobacterium TaxID=196869 RepID=UPI003614BDD5
MDFKKYFQSYDDYFWKAELYIDDFGEWNYIYEIPVTQDTIAYSDYILEILDLLSVDTIPPLGSLLLAIIATNPESEKGIAQIETFLNRKVEEYNLKNFKYLKSRTIIGFLKQLQALPNEYKVGEKRILLFQTIFNECHNRISGDSAKKMLTQFKNYEQHFFKENTPIPFNQGNFIKDFRTIALLKTTFPLTQSIINAMENLPQEELNEKWNEEILEDTSTLSSEEFIDQLVQNEQTFPVGSLIKRIWSGLTIPLHHNTPSMQPLGGISDLTNKGDFDKLLISEFANDEDVFLSRIANHEALYIQREIPPQPDDFKRVLLIDTTLRNWGNPKNLSFASALAVAKHPKTDIDCEVFALGEDYTKVYINSIAQVIDGLGKLNGLLDCGAGLESFIMDHEKEIKHRELFLFTTEESLKQLPMQRAMNSYGDTIKYVFIAQADGMIRIYKSQNKGRKLLQQMILPLEELWARKQQKSASKSTILALNPLHPIPLLYSIDRNYQAVFHHNGIYYAYFNRGLYRFSEEKFKKGLTKVASDLPFVNGRFAMVTDAKGRDKLLIYNYEEPLELTLIDLQSGSVIEKKKVFDTKLSNQNLFFFSCKGVFHCKGELKTWTFEENLKLLEDNRKETKEAYNEYEDSLSQFVMEYQRSKPRYNIVRRLDRIQLYDNVFYFNSFIFDTNTLHFHKNGYPTLSMIANHDTKFEMKVNLYLKRPSSKMLPMIKAIKEEAGLSLQKANEIANEGSGLILSNISEVKAKAIKETIEKTGAVCFTETIGAESKDGSTITNQNGVLVFKSSNEEIPVFYIPFVMNCQTAMASEKDFTGNPYFKEEGIQLDLSPEVFIQNYYRPFIYTIITHAT